MSEAFVAFGGGPAGKRIQTASERPVGVNRAALRPEKDTAAVVSARLQDGAAGLGVAGEEFGRADAEPARQPERLVRPYADRLSVATPVAGVADVRVRAVTPEAEVDSG